MTTTAKQTSPAHLTQPGHPSRRGRPAKTHDNRAVRAWLRSYWDRWDFSATNPRAEDALAGAVNLRTQGDTGRGLSINRLFHVLRSLDTITTAGVAAVLSCAKSTAEAYTRAARVASGVLEPLAVNSPPGTAPVEAEDWEDFAVPDNISDGV
ncbi:hypothetical protein B2J88_17840 [Rhodococcus sp. SRB_17]|uniref:hypothetical protein n=1 Tax=Acidovorax sp. SRB_24 TaxID=1962700 RepID=UPI00145FAC8B|nr:hypothetical protein [Acidovorax sp. SRB_24]NMM75642.1 hypothetical protein [Acidovorax sp. SRB_24]NMM86208.1 hypothetical protein [Rhodococcus sp. SRB_17]